MQIELAPAQITALLNKLPPEANGPTVGFDSDGTTLTIPDAWVSAAQAIMAVPGWDTTQTVAQLLAYGNSKQAAVLAQVWTFDVGQNGASKKVTTRLDTAGQAAMMKIALWAATAGQSTATTIPYSNVDFSSTTLSPAEAASLTLNQAGGVEMQSFTALNTVAAGIMATPPTVTTFAEIDAAAWPAPAPTA